MRRLLIGATMLLVLMAPRMASAQAKAGDQELLVQGLIFTTVQSGSTSTFGTGIFNLGEFLSDTFEVGGGPSVQVSGGFGGTTVSVGANGFVRKYFPGSRPTVQPFAGLEVADQDFSDFSNQLFINVLGGVKDYLTEKSALEMSLGYGLSPNNTSIGLLQFKIGLTVLFGK